MVQCLPALKKIPFLYFHIYLCLQVFGRIKHGNENGRFHECCSSFLECRYIVGDVQLHRTAPQSSVVCTQWTQLWFLGLFKKWRFWQTPGARTFHSKTSSLGWLIWLIPADNRQSQMGSLFYFFLNLIFFCSSSIVGQVLSVSDEANKHRSFVISDCFVCWIVSWTGVWDLNEGSSEWCKVQQQSQ